MPKGRIGLAEKDFKLVTPADVLAKYTGPVTDAACQVMHDQELPHLYEAQDRRDYLRCETAARPARQQENRKGE
jgi:hypothetical protein